MAKLPNHLAGLDEVEYREMLEAHDWFFQFSDDATVYRKGLSAESDLREAQKHIDPDYTIWNTYAPKEYQIDRSHLAGKPANSPTATTTERRTATRFR
jgi:hypothetical protein